MRNRQTRRGLILAAVVFLTYLSCAVPRDLLTTLDPATPEIQPVSPVSVQPTVAPEQGPAPTLGRTQPTMLPFPTPKPGATGLDVPLIVRDTAGVAHAQEPVTSGIPIPRALNLTDLSRLRLLDATGKPTAAQFTPLARWGGAPQDASKPVRWLLLDFQADVPASGTATYRLADSGGAQPALPALVVSENASAVAINSGAAQFSIGKQDGRLTAPGLSAPIFGRATDARSATYTTAGPVSITVALTGPMRVSISVQGAYRDPNGKVLLSYTSRYWFYAGQPYVRLFHTVENNNPCPLGEYEELACFDIGSGGSVNVGDVSLVVPTHLGGPLRYQAGVQGSPISGALSADLTLYQDSSGTESWDRYPTLKDWDGKPLDTRPRMQSYVSFRGYRATVGGATVHAGNQAAGWLNVAGENGAYTIGVRDFWQNFPKALRASPNGTLQIGLFPDEFGGRDYSFNLRAGEHKTHEVTLGYADMSASSGGRLPASLPGLFAQAPAQWYVESGALGLTTLPNKRDWNDYEQYVEYQLTTAPNHDRDDYFKNIPDAIERTDFYGIFDYGDWPIDYEGFEAAPLNPKYNNDLGMWLQWARSGDSRWFDLAQAADRHFADIDILHNRHNPRHWGDGIAFGHSEHDEAGFTNPHRNRNSGNPDTAYTEAGLWLAYYLTGYEKARESATELADAIDWRLRNDERLCDKFPGCNGAGYVLGDGLYENGSRPVANSLNIVVAAYRATGDARYSQVADTLVEWAKPSAQPYMKGPLARDERMMKPWLLTMYLRALADYIDVGHEFGLPDTHDARGSYLAYAQWLGRYALIDLTPIDTGPRAAFPFEWWFDGRKNIAGEENDNGDASINNWLLLGADVMAYAYRLSGDGSYFEQATRLFRTGSRDPWYQGDPNHYAESKETVNSITFGHLFLYEWAKQRH